jgi:curved DNA-binding protein CbpA
VTPDLYATLGLPRGADRAAIRRAYRRAAKHAHPDLPGGSNKRFELVKLAHDTLTDEAARRHYDDTGEINEKPPDNRKAEALQCLATALEQALQKIVTAGGNPEERDIPAVMRTWIQDEIAKCRKNIDVLEKTVLKNQSLGRRFVGEVMTQIMAGRIAMLNQQIASLTKNQVTAKAALELLADVTFLADVPVPRMTKTAAIYQNTVFLS